MRENSVPGEKWVRNRPLFDRDKIVLPLLHIKLGLMKNFIKTVNKHGKGFEYLRVKFPKLSDAKLKEGIFIGPQICEIINDDLYEHLLMETEKSAWLTFKVVCPNVLGNVKAENYWGLVENLLNAYQTRGVICHWRFILYIPTWVSFLWTWAQWATNMGRGSIRTFWPRRKDMQESCDGTC